MHASLCGVMVFRPRDDSVVGFWPASATHAAVAFDVLNGMDCPLMPSGMRRARLITAEDFRAISKSAADISGLRNPEKSVVFVAAVCGVGFLISATAMMAYLLSVKRGCLVMRRLHAAACLPVRRCSGPCHSPSLDTGRPPAPGLACPSVASLPPQILRCCQGRFR